MIYKLSSQQPSTSQQYLSITHSLTISSNLTWKLSVHDTEVTSTTCQSLSSVPAILSHNDLTSFLTLLDTLRICPGNPDNHFLEMADSRKGKFETQHGATSAVVDSNAHVFLNGEEYYRTIRSVSCEMVTNEVKCPECKRYRSTLRSGYSRWYRRNSADKVTQADSHVNHRYMNTPEKLAKINSLREKAKVSEQDVKKLKTKIEILTRTHGELLNTDLQKDLIDLVEANSTAALSSFPEGSFSRLFFEQQIKAVSVKDRRQVRWHPLMVKWCLNLKLLSSGAYHAMRSSGFITLPSERTLRDYTNYIDAKVGFQPEVLQQLEEEAKISTRPESHQYVGLLIDEMKVKEDIVYNKHTGQMIGFVRLGDLNDQLLALERKCDNDESESIHPTVAKHILCLMVRGMFFKLEFPLAHFSTECVTADILFPIVWDGIRQLETAGFKVISITCDGASPNRKFFRMHSTDKNVHKVVNPFSKEKRFVYFISDPPHLMKTTRNCWSHSFGHNQSRKLLVRLSMVLCSGLFVWLRCMLLTLLTCN